MMNDRMLHDLLTASLDICQQRHGCKSEMLTIDENAQIVCEVKWSKPA